MQFTPSPSLSSDGVLPLSSERAAPLPAPDAPIAFLTLAEAPTRIVTRAHLLALTAFVVTVVLLSG